MNWTRVGQYGLKSGQWCIGKILSGGVPKYVLSKTGGDSLGWFETSDEAKQKAEDLQNEAV